MAEVEGELSLDTASKPDRAIESAGESTGYPTARSSGPARPSPPSRVRSGGRQLHPLVELTMTRLREFVREPEAVFWIFVFPVLLACALGIAFRNTTPEKIRVAVEDVGGSDAAAIASILRRSPDLDPVVSSPAEATASLRGGKVALVVRPAAQTGRNGTTGAQSPDAAGWPTTASSSGGVSQPYSLDYRYDPTRPDSRAARLAVDDALQRGMGRADVAAARDERVSEPGARYIDFLVPGLIGMNLMGSGMWGLGFTIVQARNRKLLKRFAATPMRRSHYLMAFMLSRLIFMILEVATVIGFAWVAFGVAVRGSLLSVGAISVIGALMFGGLGLLVAARPRTIEGVSGLMNFVMLPMWLLSGTFFSSARFPQSAQPFIKALPLTALNDALRAVMSDGAPLVSSWPQLTIMLVWCLACFVLALRIFRWQ